MSSNPLVRKGEETAATEGAGLFHDATEAVKGFSEGHWAEGLLNAGGAIAGVAGFMVDPIAGLISAGFGWLIEHVDFLREPLDWLTGDQQTLDGMSKTWSSVSSYMEETATLLKDAVQRDTASWQGKDSENYREFGVERADVYGTVSTVARGMSMLITLCKTILKVVRDIVRDLISEAVAKLISICIRWAPAVAAFGAGVAGAIAEAVPTAIKYANKALDWCRKLTKAFGKAGGLFKHLDSLLERAQKFLTKSGDNLAATFKATQAADARRVNDYVNRGDTGIPFGMIGRDAVKEAKQVVIDGTTGLPGQFLRKEGLEFGKEVAKGFDQWQESGSPWKTWRELKQEELQKDAEKRVEAQQTEARRREREQK
ncbi:hypothetical protein Lesp02_41210 [Lentzea sp. NBRC 105346]|uniref:hypothetical protein n=1 Tax=Lentzea sp. NBRC 105346 TaxID=3032205 RepID=UPI0024A38447|nr:hypothetical protein [Lentzea sp. NBRC 105346]GLZ31933.1 hypothetical protein Lesp02_41210 [Lentzea sp. NBRC 105346]